MVPGWARQYESLLHQHSAGDITAAANALAGDEHPIDADDLATTVQNS